MAITEETSFQVLSIVDKCDGQVDLAKQLGFSLGKVNFIVKALVDKGLVKMTNFATSDKSQQLNACGELNSPSRKKRNYKYLLTPAGINEKLTLTEKFIMRKQAEYEQLEQQLAETRAQYNSIKKVS